MKKHLILICLLGAALLSGCGGGAVPLEKLDFVGHWRSPIMDLRIAPNGEVSYRRLDRSISVQVTAPLQSLGEDGFRIGYGLMSSHFDVDVAPHQQHGIWKMTVDGVELTRIDDHETLESI